MPEAVAEPVTDPNESPFEPIPANPVTKPARRDHLTRITPERSRQMRAASLAGRARAKAEREKAHKERELLLKRLTEQVQANPAPVPTPANPELDLVEEQIKRIREQLLEDMEPTERAQLVRALDLMLDRKRMILMIPGPGTYRPTAQPKASRIQSLLGPDE